MSNVIHFFIMHNITSVVLLCKLFLLLFISFPFLVLGYLGHLQPVGHLPVGTKRTASTQPAHTHSQKRLCSIHAVATLWSRLIQEFQKHIFSGFPPLLHSGASKTAALQKHINKIKKKKRKKKQPKQINVCCSYPDLISGGTGRGLVNPSLPTSQ